MVLPVRDHAAQQRGTTEERAVGGGGPPEGDVVPTTRARVCAVELETLGGEAASTGLVVEDGRGLGELVPGRGRMKVDLDHSRVRRHHEAAHASIARGWVALDHDGAVDLRGGFLDVCHQLECGGEVVERGQEHVDATVTAFHAHRGRRSVVDRHDLGRRGDGDQRACRHVARRERGGRRER